MRNAIKRTPAELQINLKSMTTFNKMTANKI